MYKNIKVYLNKKKLDDVVKNCKNLCNFYIYVLFVILFVEFIKFNIVF